MSDIKHRVKTFIRLLLGVYTANDYIRLGRYLAGGGTAKFVKKKFDRIGVVYHLRISKQSEETLFWRIPAALRSILKQL